MTLAQFLVWLTTHRCVVWITPNVQWRFVGSCYDAFIYGWQLHLPVTLWKGWP